MDQPATPITPAPLSNNPIGPDGKPLKICCSCPQTKTVRDECVLMRGEENCSKEIEIHKDCLRALGFKL